MYNNFGAPRNDFRSTVPQAGTSQMHGNAWHQPPPPNFYPPPGPFFEEPPQFILQPGGFSNRPLDESGGPTSEVPEQQLVAILSKYQTSENPRKASRKLNVSSISRLLSEYRRLIQNVDSTVKYLEVTKKNLSDDDWAVKCRELDKKKVLLTEIEDHLNDPVFVDLVTRTVNRVKAKRGRIKRKKAAWSERKKELLDIREEKHKTIDLWLEKMKDEVERAQRAEVVKQQADIVLSDVTRKKNEAKRVLGLFNSLSKLRNAKLQQLPANRKVSEEETKSFNLVIEKLKSMWAKQLKECNLEEQGLKVMLNDAEVQRVNTEERTWRQNMHLWTETLFGEKNVFDPMQAQPLEMEQFALVRKNWDAFVAVEDSMMSSSIPAGWILPVKPSSEEWELCLRKI